MKIGTPVGGAIGILLLSFWAAGPSENAAPPIHFAYRPIDFRLESCETPRRHAPETMAGGVAVFDYNKDGHLDVFFSNGADIQTLKKSEPKYSNRLFENDGQGNFKDVTVRAGLVGAGFDVGVAVGDYDNDGYPDLFVGGVHGNRLYHNNGDGTFTDVTAEAGLPDKPDPQYGPLWSVGGAWLDVNNDGLLDLFVVNYLAWDIRTEPACEAAPGRFDYCHPKFYKATPNQLFLNNGDGTFRDVSAESGIRAHPGKGMGVGVADYDLDGLPDIFVANDKVYNSLFHNLGGGKFEEVAFEAGVALADNGQFISGMGVDFKDLDNDGYPDIAFVALDNETFPLFRNTGKRGFVDATERSGMSRLSAPMAGYSPTIADFDNDGWKDLFAAQSHVLDNVQDIDSSLQYKMLPFLALNHKGHFELADTGVTTPIAARGAAFGDINNDGWMDVVIATLGGPPILLLNRGGANHWLTITLEGTRSNRDGFGARVRLNGQTRFATATAGYSCANDKRLHFGLGDAKTASVEVLWPSGTLQTLKDVPADQFLKIREPEHP